MLVKIWMVFSADSERSDQLRNEVAMISYMCEEFYAYRDENNETIRSEWLWRSCVVDVYLAPTVCVLGFLLNLICAVIFCAYPQNKRSNLVPYLIGLCIFDALQLLLSIFVLILPAIHEYTRIPHLSAFGQVILQPSFLWATIFCKFQRCLECEMNLLITVRFCVRQSVFKILHSC